MLKKNNFHNIVINSNNNLHKITKIKKAILNNKKIFNKYWTLNSKKVIKKIKRNKLINLINFKINLKKILRNNKKYRKNYK